MFAHPPVRGYLCVGDLMNLPQIEISKGLFWGWGGGGGTSVDKMEESVKPSEMFTLFKKIHRPRCLQQHAYISSSITDLRSHARARHHSRCIVGPRQNEMCVWA